MAVNPTKTAARMGARAGADLARTGVPTRNPFSSRPVLAAAWRRAYLRALAAG